MKHQKFVKFHSNRQKPFHRLNFWKIKLDGLACTNLMINQVYKIHFITKKTKTRLFFQLSMIINYKCTDANYTIFKPQSFFATKTPMFKHIFLYWQALSIVAKIIWSWFWLQDMNFFHNSQSNPTLRLYQNLDMS